MNYYKYEHMTVILIGPSKDNDRVCGHARGISNIINSALLKNYVEFKYIPLTIPKEYIKIIRLFVDIIRVWNGINLYKKAIVQIECQYQKGIIRDLLITWLSKKCKHRVIIDIRAGSFKRAFEKKGIVKYLYRAMSKNLCSLADEIFVQCPKDLEFIKNTCLRPDAKLLPNCVPKEEFNQFKSIALKGNRFNPLKLLYTGRLVVEKGIFDTIEALKILGKEGREIEYHIAGDDRSSGIRKKLLKEAEKLPISTRFYDHGFLRYEDLLNLYVSSHIFCFPTYDPAEGHSNSLNEAMMVGLACIISIHNHLPDIVTEDGAAWVPIKDPYAIADAIRSFQDSPEKISLAGEINRKTIKKNYLDDKVHKSLLDVYNELNVK